jgi:glycosyltransferase 2 family protein
MSTDSGITQEGASTQGPARARIWRSIVFAPEGDGNRRRRGSDGFRLGAALVIVLVGLAIVRVDPGPEHEIVHFFSPPPDGIRWLVTTTYILGSFGLIVILGAVAFLSHRRAVLRDLTLAGAAAFGFSALMWLVFGSTGGRPHDASLAGYNLDYPVAIVVVVVAVAMAALPYLSRSVQRLVELVVALAALATVVAGYGLPVNVAASVALGWGTVALLHLVFGSPLGLPSGEELAAVVEDLGVLVGTLQPSRHQVWGVARYTGIDRSGGPLAVSLYGRDAADAQLLSKTGRFFFYRDSGPTLSFSRVQQVEHEAYMTLLAERAGVATSHVLVAGIGGPSRDAVLVVRSPVGVPLAELDESSLTDPLLDACFSSVLRLRKAGIAHGALSGDTIIVDPEHGVVSLVDLRTSSASPSQDRLDADMAGALAAVGLVAGPEATAAAARRVLPEAVVTAALPHLRRASLDRVTSKALKGRSKLLEEVRTRTAQAFEIEVPKLAEPKRVSWGTLIMTIGTLIGGWALILVLIQVGQSFDTIKGAAWGWVAVTAVLAQLAYPSTALSVVGTVRTALPFGRVVALEFANAFTSLAGGTPATFGTRVRFFQLQGSDATQAVTSGALVSTSSWIVKGLLFLISLPLAWSSFNFSNDGTDTSGDHGKAVWLILAVIVAVIVLIGVALAVPRLRRLAADKARPKLLQIWADLKLLAAQPSKLIEVFGGALAAQVLVALALGTALHAFGEQLSLATIFIVITLASMLGGVSPVPGGMGVVEAGMILALTAAGVPENQAVAATFVQRMFTSYLPPLWGWFVLAWMRKREYL